jgi:hypothetical protein
MPYAVPVTLPDRTMPLLPEPFARWFASRGWRPRAHQLDLLAKAQAGTSVLLIAPTGGGKTLAGFLPSLVELSAAATRVRRPPLRSSRLAGKKRRKDGSIPSGTTCAAAAACTHSTFRR